MWFFTTFVNWYLAVPRPSLVHGRGNSLTNPILITVFDSWFDPNATGSNYDNYQKNANLIQSKWLPRKSLYKMRTYIKWVMIEIIPFANKNVIDTSLNQKESFWHHATLGHYLGDRLTNPMLITAFLQFQPKDHR